MAPKLPRTWSSDELRAHRDLAEDLFKKEREREGLTGAFEGLFREILPVVRQALEATSDLRSLDAGVIVEHPGMWHILRYFCAPPVSEEDFWTLVGQKFTKVPPARGAAAAQVIVKSADRVRLPWLAEDRAPTTTERESAILATAALFAHEKFRTQRRGKASKRQEALLATALETVGFVLDRGKKKIATLDVLPRGAFSRERYLNGSKCDVPIRLKDGRLLAVECKVSNGPKNGYKRLNREVGGKAKQWKVEFGEQVVTGALMAGVFDLICLEKGQNENGVFLFWQHDLTSLLDYVASIT